MSTIKRSKTDAFSVKESVNIVKLAEAAFEQISLDQLTDVVVETPTDGDILVYSSDLMAWENVPQAGLNYDLEDLDNITITSVADGQVLTWDSGTSKWVNETPTTGATTLDGLTDVTISTPSNGQVLKYNGSAWVNGADSGATPGGSDTHVQYNDGGALGGKSSFTFNETTDTLSVPKVSASDGLYTLSASTLGFGSARIYDSGDEMGFIVDVTDNLGLDTRAFRFNTASTAPEFYDGTTYREVYHTGNTKTVNGQSIAGSGDISVSGGMYPRFIRYKNSWAHLLTQGSITFSVQELFYTTANRVYYWPVCRTHAITIENLCIFYDSTVNGQVGIYSNDTTGGYDHPGTLLASASATGSDIKDVVLSTPVNVPAGDLVWFAYTNAGAYRIRGTQAGGYSSLQPSIDRVTSPSFPQASMYLFEDTGSFGLPASAASSLVKALNTSGPTLPSVFFQI